MDKNILNKPKELLWPFTGEALEKQYLHTILEIEEPFAKFQLKEVTKAHNNYKKPLYQQEDIKPKNILPLDNLEVIDSPKMLPEELENIMYETDNNKNITDVPIVAKDIIDNMPIHREGEIELEPDTEIEYENFLDIDNTLELDIRDNEMVNEKPKEEENISHFNMEEPNTLETINSVENILLEPEDAITEFEESIYDENFLDIDNTLELDIRDNEMVNEKPKEEENISHFNMEESNTLETTNSVENILLEPEDAITGFEESIYNENLESPDDSSVKEGFIEEIDTNQDSFLENIAINTLETSQSLEQLENIYEEIEDSSMKENFTEEISLEEKLKNTFSQVVTLHQDISMEENSQKRIELEALLVELDSLIQQLPKDQAMDYEKKKYNALYSDVYDKLGL